MLCVGSVGVVVVVVGGGGGGGGGNSWMQSLHQYASIIYPCMFMKYNTIKYLLGYSSDDDKRLRVTI